MEQGIRNRKDLATILVTIHIQAIKMNHSEIMMSGNAKYLLE
jgi:hypothetical protein